MSDRDIRKLYEGIQRGESHDSPVREKDLYEQVLREATITISYDDKSVPKQTFKMSDELARSLGTHESKLKLPQLFEKWCETGGWTSKTAKKAIPAGLVDRLTSIYNLNEPDVVNSIINEVETIIQLKSEKQINILTSSISDKSFNIINTVRSYFGDQLPKLTSVKFLTQLMGLSDFTEGNVGVGNGEVLMTLFTEAVNPDKGDLMLPSGEEVELKGESGRPGKGDVVNRAIAFERHAMKNFADFDENRRQDEILKIKEPLMTDISAIYPFYSERPDVHNKLKDLYNRLKQTDCCDYEELLKMTSGVVKQLTNKSKYNVVVLDAIEQANRTSYVQDIITKFNHIKNTLGQRTKKPTGGAGYIGSYLSKYGFGKFKTDLDMQSEFAKDLSKLSAKPKEAYKAILSIINNVITDGVLDQTHIVDVGLRIMSSIQIADYATSEGFEYYVAMCEVSGENYSNCYSIGPFDNYGAALVDAFDVLMKTNASIGASTGGKAGESGRGGFTIKLNN